MPRSTQTDSLRRIGVLTSVALAVTLAATGPAAAHTEVEAEGARALDQNVELTFSAESESGTAGISKLEVILPEGMVPQDVTYEEGPKGWKFAPTGRGYTVSGPKLAVGEDAEYVVTVRQLPDAKEVVFKTLQSYSDGKVDRWIELEEAEGDGHGHGHPAPRLALKAAAPGAESVSPTPTDAPTTPAPSATASDEPAAEQSSTQPVADDAKDDDGMSAAVPVGIGAAVVVVLGGGAWWMRRRRGGAA
ncbi:DUF1775 domain-containing protein [Streptomyces sp. NPDC098781]|uniref:DUF1775 domain-containing protein n=1 Tax=Streptomyces sp. NPDC098781 TaxID=3366097 RepID=UPI003806501F